MKIALIGYGKIGHLIEEIALERGHIIVVKYSTRQPTQQIDLNLVQDADVCIDFSHPACVIDNIYALAELGKPIVVGTTGWYDQIPEIKQLVTKQDIGFLYAPNFSVGVMAFMQVVRFASKLLNKFKNYDVGGIEMHHNQKADTPSGTAEELARIILEEFSRKSSVLYEVMDRDLAHSEFHFASLRCGKMPGTHSIFFDSESDTIELTHTARDRRSFARGAILAAEWLKNKKGFFSFQDLYASITH